MNTKQVMPPPTRISAFQRPPKGQMRTPIASASRKALAASSGHLLGFTGPERPMTRATRA